MVRNFHRWQQQYEASRTGDEPEAMDELMTWLSQRMPDTETCTAYSEQQRETCENICINRSGKTGRCLETCGSCNLESGDVDCSCEAEVCKGGVCRCRGGVTRTCADKHQDIVVSELKIHESYRTLRSRIAVYDIMLVKLKHTVNINKFASPICFSTKLEARRIQNFGEKGAD